MKISTSRPPNYPLFLQFFPGHAKYKPIFVYGDTIYNPFNEDLTPDRIYHEAVHSKQQGNDPEAWYSRYFTDPYFRLDQELEAYREQYAFFDRAIKDREIKSHFLNMLAEALSSPLYGNLVTHSEAWKLIRQGVV